MIIKSGERVYEIVVLLFVVCIGLWVALFIFVDGQWDCEDIAFQLWCSGLFLIPLYYWLRDCKKIIIDMEGCTIFLGPFKKKYQWNEMKTKKVENYKGWNAYVKNYAKGTFFTTKQLNQTPLKFRILWNPLSYFYVFFPESKVRDYRLRKGSQIPIPEYYEVEEEVFYKQLETWGIELEKIEEDGVLSLEELRKQLNIQPFSIKEPKK